VTYASQLRDSAGITPASPLADRYLCLGLLLLWSPKSPDFDAKSGDFAVQAKVLIFYFTTELRAIFFISLRKMLAQKGYSKYQYKNPASPRGAKKTVWVK
jgi:hypothetical protein